MFLRNGYSVSPLYLSELPPSVHSLWTDRMFESHRLTLIWQFLPSYPVAFVMRHRRCNTLWCNWGEIKPHFSRKDKNEIECIASGPFQGYLDMKCKYWLTLNPSIDFNSCLPRHKTILLSKRLIIKMWYNRIYMHEEMSLFSQILTGDGIAFFSVLFSFKPRTIYQKK